MILRVEVLMDVDISEEFEERLGMGSEEAFKELEAQILSHSYVLKRCEILSAGPHNTARFTCEDD